MTSARSTPYALLVAAILLAGCGVHEERAKECASKGGVSVVVRDGGEPTNSLYLCIKKEALL